MSGKTLWQVRESLGKDDRGVIRGVRVDTWHWTGAVHCLDAWGWWPFDDKVVVGDWAFCRKFGSVIPDPVVTELPPVATQVYQVTPKGELRTSRIRRYITVAAPSEVLPIGALLHPAGPFAGVPVGGDSGSICFVREFGQWKVLGVVSHGSRVELSRPISSGTWAVKPLLIPSGVALSDDASMAALEAPWRLEGEMWFPASVPMAAGSIPVLDLPKEAADGVSPYSATPDGVPDVLLEVASPYPVEDIGRIEVEGAGGDKWVWPPNGTNWSMWRHDGADDRIVLRFNRSQPADSYQVTLRHKLAGIHVCRASPMTFTNLPVVEPEKPAMATPDPEASKAVEDLQRELAVMRVELEAERNRAAGLADELKLYHDENASLRDTLAMERDRAAGLRLGLEMVGKEMGWAP